MKEKPLVSVIIPTYKSNETLRRAIDSVLDQKYYPLEVIVVDDNNPDDIYRAATEKIMRSYSSEPKLKYLKHDKNLNGAAARNTGFKASSGQYICFLDDDDIFLENKIHLQVVYLEKNVEFGAAYCYRYQNNKVISYNKIGDLSKEILSLEYTPCTPSLMVRKECFESLNGFNESYARHQDFEFLLRFFKNFKIGVVEVPLIKLGTNDIDNMVHGIKLNQLKSKFLKEFKQSIEEIDKRENGFKEKVYAIHYLNTLRDHIIHHKYFLSIITLILGLYKSRMRLLSHLLKYRRTRNN